MSERNDAVDSANDCPVVDEISLLDASFRKLERKAYGTMGILGQRSI